MYIASDMKTSEPKKFGLILDVTFKATKKDLMKRFRDNDIDLTPEQWTVLDSLANRGKLAQKELAAGTFKDAPTVSRIVDLLVQCELITRTSDRVDRRILHIDLTEKGQMLYERTLSVVVEARKQGWKGLTDEDYDTFKRILETISNNVQTTA